MELFKVAYQFEQVNPDCPSDNKSTETSNKDDE
jgi:hypothetical protein